MARKHQAYGLGAALMNMAPSPIVSQRAPQASDVNFQIGQHWIDEPNQAEYTLVAMSGGSAVWTTSPASGVGSFSSLTVNPGNATVTAGDLTVSAGDFGVTAGNTTLGGDLTVAGTTTVNGDFDLASSALIDLTSTLDGDPAIYLHANGGTSETIRLRADQGTGTDSIDLVSDVGGITLTASGLASDDAINLVASAGGVDVDAALQLNLASSENAADAIVISASAGGIDLTAAGAAGEDLDLVCTSGSANLSGGEDAADAVVISAGAGGIDVLATGEAGQDIDIVNTGGSVNIQATEDSAEAVFIEADGGTSERVHLHSDQGTGADSIFLESDDGGVTLTGGLANDTCIDINATAGGVDVDCALQLNLTSSEAAADAIVVTASDAAGGIDITSGTGDTDISSSGDINISSTNDAANCILLHENGGSSSSIYIHADQGEAVDSISLDSDAGGITLAAGLASDDAINVSASAGGVDVDAALQLNLASSEAAADAIVINASDASGGIDISTAGGSIDFSSSGFMTMAPATATVAGTSLTINADVGSATFTGQTTASAAQETFTITNSQVAADSALFVTVTNVGSNDARMTLERVKAASGSFEVMTQNNGAAALNGDVIINFWRIA